MCVCVCDLYGMFSFCVGSDTFKLVLFSDDNDEEGQGKEELARKSSKEYVSVSPT